MADAPELMPCPFCGGRPEADIYRHSDNDEGRGIVTCGCGAETVGPGLNWMDGSKEQAASIAVAVSRWNARADLAPQWQPIETAPRDETQFIFNVPQVEGGISIGVFAAGKLCSAFNGKVLGDWVTPPTHWMPLPTPPQGDA